MHMYSSEQFDQNVAINLIRIAYEISNKRNNDKAESTDVSGETDCYAAQLRGVKFTGKWIYN